MKIGKLAAELAAAKRERDTYWRALSAMTSDVPDHVEHYTTEGCRYVMRLYHAASCHGGLVITEFHCDGQSTQVSAEYLETLISNDRSDSWHASLLPYRIALEHTVAARNRACQAATVQS